MKRIALVVWIGLGLFLTTGAAHAQLEISITQGHRNPMPIAIPALPSNAPEGAETGRNISRVISANLERSGLFRPIDPRAFIEQIAYGVDIPRFPDWRQINAQVLVTGSVTPAGGNKVKVIYRLWDVLAGQLIGGKEYTTLTENWRRVSHLISDEIYKRLTGEEGYFDTKIVYVAESGPARRRIKRIAIMDQDGYNHEYLTDGKHLVLTPRFSPNSQRILYLSYAGGTPRVYIRDLQSGREEVLGDFPGMSFAPRFSHDGQKIVMSVARDGNTEIFEMDLRTRRTRQLTRNPAIDTSPSYSPDGSQIVFNSDRGGSQQLYVMDADGSNPHRISFGKGRYGTPVWSPRQDLIAFTKMLSGTFYIGVMRPDGEGERLLAEGYLVEGPTWSPNGRVIIYTREERGHGTQASPSRLYSVDVTGFNEREVVTPMDASDPAWSPLLPM